MSIDSTELNQAFQNFIDEVDNDDDGNFISNKLPLDTYLLYVNANTNSHFIQEGQSFQLFDSHEDAKSVASTLARNNPENRISILRVVENVGFMPY